MSDNERTPMDGLSCVTFSESLCLCESDPNLPPALPYMDKHGNAFCECHSETAARFGLTPFPCSKPEVDQPERDTDAIAWQEVPAVAEGEERLTIWVNKKLSRGKGAAAAVHAALYRYGIDHGAVVVLGYNATRIEEGCGVVVRDAGRTEVAPGTPTAGIPGPLFADEWPITPGADQ